MGRWDEGTELRSRRERWERSRWKSRSREPDRDSAFTQRVASFVFFMLGVGGGLGTKGVSGGEGRGAEMSRAEEPLT